MHVEFSRSFPDYTIFICKFKIDECFFIHETFLVYKLETFKNCKEVKQIMIMTIATIYIFYLIYLINSWKLLSEKPLPLPWKKNSLPPPEDSKSASSPLFANIENFSVPPPPLLQKAEEGRNDTSDHVGITDLLLASTSYILRKVSLRDYGGHPRKT